MPKHTAASGQGLRLGDDGPRACGLHSAMMSMRQGLRLGDDGPRACGLCSAMAMTSMRLNAAWVPARGGNAAAEAMPPPMPVPARTAWLLGHVAAWRWPEGLRQWLGMCIACFAQMMAAAHVHMCMAQLHVSALPRGLAWRMAKHIPHKANSSHATFVLKPVGNSLLCNTIHHGALCYTVVHYGTLYTTVHYYIT